MAKLAKKKASPAVNWRTKKSIEATAIDAYEQEHKLGKYAIVDGVSTVAPPIEFPEYVNVIDKLNITRNLIFDAIQLTRSEERRADFEMAEFHFKVANRYINQAFSE